MKTLKAWRQNELITEIICVLIIAATFMLLTWMGWLKWNDPLTDFGAELYVPWQLHEGAVLYRDLASFKGPFSPYLNLLWFNLFGVSLRTLVWANLGILILLATGLTLLVRRCTDRLTATVAAVIFLTEHGLESIAGNNMNFVTPFVHELTHGITLSIFLLLALIQIIKRPSVMLSAIAGLLLGCILLTRIEVGLPAIITTVAACVLTAREQSSKSVIKHYGMLICSAAIPPIIALTALTQFMPWQQALSGILGTWTSVFATPVASTFFFKQVSGFDHPFLSIATTAISFLFMMNWVLAILLLNGLSSKALSTKTWIISTGTILLCAGIISIHPQPPLMIGHPLPITMLLVLAYVLRQTLLEKNPAERLRWSSWTLFCVFGFVLLWKIILHSRVSFYGFAHAMPGTVISVMTLVWLIPHILQQHGYKSSVFRFMAILMVIADALCMMKVSAENFSQKTTQIGSGNDTFFAVNTTQQPEALVMNNLLAAIHTYVPPDATLTPVPEGLMVNFLTHHKSSVPFLNLMVTETAIFGEPRILQSFESHPPDFITLIQRDTDDFGFHRFGTDPHYGESIQDWIDAHYHVVWSEGNDPVHGEASSDKLSSARLLQRNVGI